MWWDLEVTTQHKQLLKKNGQHAALIKADTVIDDEAGQLLCLGKNISLSELYRKLHH